MGDEAAIHGVRHTKPAFVVPDGATDCHVHVFGPAHRFPYTAERVYTPGDASIANLQAHQRALGLSRVVMVQPSPYGTDNACAVDAIARLGDRARGVAVIDPHAISDDELSALHKSGMRGARANLQTTGILDPRSALDTLTVLSDRIAPLGWHLQTFTNLAVINALGSELHKLRTTLVVDHFGGAKAALGTSQPGFDVLLSLVEKGRAYVKLSAAYRVSAQTGAADASPLARALIAANPDRMLWGSDWPHPGGSQRKGSLRDEIEPFFPIDDGAALNQLAGWVDRDRALLRRILVENPARLYGY
jgi:predicted TIM-barrel fold metal-dependent hydrolase